MLATPASINHGCRAVHRCAPLPGDPLLVSLFTALPTLPQPPQLQYTVALAVGAYADWLADTAAKAGAAEGQALIGQLLQMLIKGEDCLARDWVCWQVWSRVCVTRSPTSK